MMFGLSFLSPAFLAGVLAAALPIALHLLGRRPEVEVAFPTVRLLTRTPAEETRRRRLRDLLLLMLRVGALVLLAIAFARPYFVRASAAHAPGSVIVAVDRSFSMAAPGVFERARSAARAAVNAVRPGTPVGLMTFDDEGNVVVKPTTDREVVLRAIARVGPGFGGTSYSAALAKAGDALASGGGRVVVITDLQRSGWDRVDAAIASRVQVALTDVGGAPTNLSVGNVTRDDAGRVTATLRNSGTAARSGRSRLMVDGRARAAIPFAVAAGAAQSIVFPGPWPAHGEVVVEIDDGQGYPADNRAYGLLDPATPPALLVITSPADGSRGAFYLQRALEVDGGRLFHVDAMDAAAFSRLAARDTVQRYSAVFVLGTSGSSRAALDVLADYTRRGGGMLVSVTDQVSADDLALLLGSSLDVRFENASSLPGGLLAADIRHPLMQRLPTDVLGEVRFDRVARAAVRNGTVLARFGDGRPALTEVARGGGRVLLFTSDLSNRWNDLPLQPAFVPLVHEVARYLAGNRVSSRDLVVAQLPPTAARQPGIVRVPAAGGASGSRVVVNVDSRESSVGRMTVGEFEQQIQRSSGGVPAERAAGTRRAGEQQALWRVFIALAIGVLVVESRVAKTARS